MRMRRTSHFGPALFRFLRDLAANNRREWFTENRTRYDEDVVLPARRFITDVGPHLRKISKKLVADPRPVGGSMFRIYRDVRFSKDKSPYKTHVGIHFRHADGGNVHCPGYYLHLEPGNVFAAAGIWHPEGPTLQSIRTHLAKNRAAWKKALEDPRFRARFTLSGDSLKRPPRGFDPDHPLIEDLKRKDHIAVTKIKQADVTASDFLERFIEICGDGKPYMRFLCRAIEVGF
ncbi:MAG: TIGR02453 family protein [Candidatus Latescibacteria bacterium]|nr:TIGR02453 family protein [Candidatus Latescibacterota bacterium]